MQVYLVYAPTDTAFAKKLSNDLQKSGIMCIPADSETPLHTPASNIPVIVALSTAATNDPTMLATLDILTQHQNRLIALRIGPVDDLPQSLRGVLPLDFSNPESYIDALETLLEDLAPPATHTPLLPDNIQAALDHSNPQIRMKGIEMLGNLRHELEDDIHELAVQKLRDMAFKDSDSSVNHLARSTLQLLSTHDADTAPLSEDTAPLASPPPTPPRVPDPPPLQSKTTTSIPLWNSGQWWGLPILGVILALMPALSANNIALIVPIVVVWIVLPWLNVRIRDEGKLDWRMPGPLIGNGFMALVLSLLSLVPGIILSDLDTIDFLIMLILSATYGAFIGWLSTLYVEIER